MTKKKKIEKIFIQEDKLNLTNFNYKKCLERYSNDVLEEDLGKKGDITTKLVLKKKKNGRALIKANQKGVLAGIEEAIWFIEQNRLKAKALKKDGDKIAKGDKILKISGNVKDILKIERITLNIISRMSGIATEVRSLKVQTKGKVLICPTRKTLWSLLDKKACLVGGGGSHRLGLWNFVLIKDNHLDLLNKKLEKKYESNIDKALSPFKKSKKVVEIEVEDKSQALEAAKHAPDIIMLDNFKPKKIKKTINKINKKYPEKEIIFEASGGISKHNIKKYAVSGVDVISLGYITMSVPAIDFSLNFY